MWFGEKQNFLKTEADYLMCTKLVGYSRKGAKEIQWHIVQSR